MPRPKKKRKPKSQRGKGKKKGGQIDASDALNEAMDIFKFSTDPDNADSEDKDTARD